MAETQHARTTATIVNRNNNAVPGAANIRLKMMKWERLVPMFLGRMRDHKRNANENLFGFSAFFSA